MLFRSRRRKRRGGISYAAGAHPKERARTEHAGADRARAPHRRAERAGAERTGAERARGNRGNRAEAEYARAERTREPQSSDQPVSFDVEFEPQRAAAVVPWQGELQVIDLTEKLFERFTFGHSSNRFEAHYDVSLA